MAMDDLTIRTRQSLEKMAEYAAQNELAAQVIRIGYRELCKRHPADKARIRKVRDRLVKRLKYSVR